MSEIPIRISDRIVKKLVGKGLVKISDASNVREVICDIVGEFF
jgi:hypothetical protein